jgi:hypothetical protein
VKLTVSVVMTGTATPFRFHFDLRFDDDDAVSLRGPGALAIARRLY